VGLGAVIGLSDEDPGLDQDNSRHDETFCVIGWWRGCVPHAAICHI
jgi:hypothetical protein